MCNGIPFTIEKDSRLQQFSNTGPIDPLARAYSTVQPGFNNQSGNRDIDNSNDDNNNNNDNNTMNNNFGD